MSTEQPLIRPEHLPAFSFDWLREQEARTRYMLIGRGVVAGMDVSIDDRCGIHITPGYGLSSCGHLIHLKQGRTFSFHHKQPYENPDGYPLFFKDVNGSQAFKAPEAYPVWELKPHATEHTTPLMPQTLEDRRAAFLEDKILLVYLEDAQYIPLEELETHPEWVHFLCGSGETQPDCRPFRLRFLLMRQGDLLEKLGYAEKVQQRIGNRNRDDDFIYPEAFTDTDEQPEGRDIRIAMNPALELEEIALPRLGYGPLSAELCDPEQGAFPIFPEQDDLPDPCNGLDILYAMYHPLVEEAIAALYAQMAKVQKDFRPLLTHKKEAYIEKCLEQLKVTWKAYNDLMEKGGGKDYGKERIQYFYDWCRDLIRAYHELRDELLGLPLLGFPDREAFTRHLLLGPVKKGATTYQPLPLRHHFQQPPIYQGHAERLRKIKLFHWRFLMMIEGFYFPFYYDDGIVYPYTGEDRPDPHYAGEPPDFSKIRITPSKSYDAPLGEQAIPYYYPLSQGKYSVHRFWSYQRTYFETFDRHLSYHASSSEDSYTQRDATIYPLHYSLDEAAFFRVEGHIGKPVREVLTTLKEEHSQFNLPFRIVHYSLPTTHAAKDTLARMQKMAQFLQQLHPGFEHLAGVPKGGMLILISQADGPRDLKSRNLQKNKQTVIVEPLSPATVVMDLCVPYLEFSPIPIRLHGRIVDCSIPESKIKGAKVVISSPLNSVLDELLNEVESDQDGKFSILFVPRSSFWGQIEKLVVSFFKEGYQNLEDQEYPFSDIFLEGGDLGDIELMPAKVNLTVEVEISNSENYSGNIEICIMENNECKATSTVEYSIDSKVFEIEIHDFQGIELTSLTFVFLTENHGKISSEDTYTIYACEPNEFKVKLDFGNRSLEIIPPNQDEKGANYSLHNPPKGQLKGKSTAQSVRVIPFPQQLEKIHDLPPEIASQLQETYDTLTTVPKLTAAQIHGTYKQAIEAIEALSESEGTVGRDVASVLTHTYLDRIAREFPKAITPGAKKALEGVSLPGFHLKAVLATWLEGARSSISDAYIQSLSPLME